jgi:hypothetical protein
MKKCLFLIRILAAVLLAVASLAFMIIEGALLLSGDFRLYENPAIALAQLLARLLLPTASFAVGLRAVIHARHRRFRPESLCFAAAAALTAPFASNRIGVYCFLLCALFALSQWIGQEET